MALMPKRKTPGPVPLLDPLEIELVPLASEPDYAIAKAELDRLMARFGEAEVRITRAKARARLNGANSPKPHMRDAVALVMGRVISSADPLKEIEAGELEMSILAPAIREQREVVDEVAGQLRYEASLKFAAINADAHREVLRCLEGAWEGLATIFAAYAKLRAAGYEPSTTALPALVPNIVLAIGSPNDQGGNARWMRRRLEEHGMLEAQP